MTRVVFLVDGFNLYHSVRHAQRDLDGQSTKWLDLHRLCSSYLHILGPGAEVAAVLYFSALATHLEVGNPELYDIEPGFVAGISPWAAVLVDHQLAATC